MPNTQLVYTANRPTLASVIFSYCLTPPLMVQIVAQAIQDPNLKPFKDHDGIQHWRPGTASHAEARYWNNDWIDAVRHAELNMFVGYAFGSITMLSYAYPNRDSIAQLSGPTTIVGIAILFIFMNGLETFIGSMIIDKNFDKAWTNAEHATAASAITSLIVLQLIAVVYYFNQPNSRLYAARLTMDVVRAGAVTDNGQSTGIKQPLLSAAATQATLPAAALPSAAVRFAQIAPVPTLMEIANAAHNLGAQITSLANDLEAAQEVEPGAKRAPNPSLVA